LNRSFAAAELKARRADKVCLRCCWANDDYHKIECTTTASFWCDGWLLAPLSRTPNYLLCWEKSRRKFCNYAGASEF